MKRLTFVAFLLIAPALFAQNPFQGQTNEDILSTIDALVAKRSKDKAALGHMVALLSDPASSVSVRERVVWAMGQLDMRDQVQKLVTAARDKGLLVRSAALNALIRMRARSGYPVFIDIAKSDPVLTLRQRAVLGLGLLRWEKTVQDLAALSSDERAEVRAACTLAMAATQSKKNDFSQILKEMKADPDPFVQERAQIALDLIQDRRVKYLSSPDADTRLFAANMLRYSGSSVDLKKLKEAHNSEADEDVLMELEAAVRAIEKRARQAAAKTTK